MKLRSSRKRFPVRGFFLAGALVLCLLPILWTLLASLNIRPDNASSPPTWLAYPSLDRYEEIGVAEPHFVGELLTGIALSTATTLLTVCIAFLAAYSLARSHFRGRDLLIQGCLVLASLPVIAYLLPLSTVVDSLRLSDTFIGLTLSETALFAPLAVYVLFGYMNSLPIEAEEAAWLDGANPIQTLRLVVLPNAAPGLAAAAIVVFVLSWNQVFIPLALAVHIRTIPVALIDFFTFERELDWPTAAAALIASLFPIGVFVALAHRQLEAFSLGAANMGD